MQVCLLVTSTSEATSSGLSVGRLRVKFSAVDNGNNITNNRNNRKIVVMITIVTLALGAVRSTVPVLVPVKLLARLLLLLIATT